MTVPSSAAAADSFDVVEFLASVDIDLPAETKDELSAMSPRAQVDYLVSLGADVALLASDRQARPMPVAAEILRVVAPDLPRPEVADVGAYERKEQDLAVMTLIEELEQRFPGRLGYLRFDQGASDHRQLIVPVTGLTAAEASDLNSMVVADGQVEIVSREAQTSRDELIEMKATVARGLADSIGRGLGNWSIGINTNTERIEVRISPRSTRLAGDQADRRLVQETVNELARSYLASPNAQKGLGSRDLALANLVSVEEAEMELPGTDYRESAHIRGGEWVLSDNGGVCTTNFLWVKNGGYRMGTAGHCSTTGGHSLDARDYRSFDHARLSGAANGDVGSVTHNGWTNNTRSDYALMTLPAAATGASQIMTTAGNWRTVTAVVAENAVEGPWTFCHVGYGIFSTLNLNKSCGPITQADISFTYNMNAGGQLTINGIFCIDAVWRPGDSGGPVYFESGDDAWAVGIMHGTGTTGGDTCFTTIQAAKDRHGYSVVTR